MSGLAIHTRAADSPGLSTGRLAPWVATAVVGGFLAVPFVLTPRLAGVDPAVVRAWIILAELAAVATWLWSGRATTLHVRPRPVWVGVGLAWIAASLVTTATAVHVAPAVVRTAEWAAHVVFALALASQIQNDRGLAVAVVRAVPIGFVGLLAAIAVEAAQMPDPQGHNWLGEVPYLGNVRRLGFYALAATVFAAFPLIARDASRAERAWGWTGVALGWGVLFWCGGRGSIGAGLLAMGVVGALGHRRQRAWSPLAAAMVVGALLSFCVPVDALDGLWRFLTRSTSAERFTSGRTEIWAAVAAEWWGRPWLGLGPGASAFVMAPFALPHPHNIVLQGLLEWGAVGGGAFLVGLAGVLGTGLRNAWRELDDRLAAARGVAVAYLVGASANALLGGTLFNAQSLIVTAVAVAVAVAPSRRSAPARPLPRSWRFGVGAGVGLAAVVTAVHLAVIASVWSPSVPTPDSGRVALVTAFPSTSRLGPLKGWARDWAHRDPAAARDLAVWSSRHASLPWTYLWVEADRLAALGQADAATAVLVRAGELHTETMRYHPSH